MKTVLTRRYEIRAVHHLGPESHDCSVVHGHNYFLEVSVTGSVDEVSGLVVSREALDLVVQKAILEPYDRRDLNSVLRRTAGESLVQQFFCDLEGKVPGRLVSVALQETKKNRFEATA